MRLLAEACCLPPAASRPASASAVGPAAARRSWSAQMGARPACLRSHSKTSRLMHV